LKKVVDKFRLHVGDDSEHLSDLPFFHHLYQHSTYQQSDIFHRKRHVARSEISLHAAGAGRPFLARAPATAERSVKHIRLKKVFFKFRLHVRVVWMVDANKLSLGESVQHWVNLGFDPNSLADTTNHRMHGTRIHHTIQGIALFFLFKTYS
jgi:hypothetical protein